MKVKVKWKELGKQLWEMCRALARVGREATAKPPTRAHAVKPVLLAAIGGGIVTMAAGCSSLVHPCQGIASRLGLRPSGDMTSKTQTLSVVGIGIPAIAVVSSSSQGADASGGDENKPTQANPVTTVVPISAK